jgi:hypothetical protein
VGKSTSHILEELYFEKAFEKNDSGFGEEDKGLVGYSPISSTPNRCTSRCKPRPDFRSEKWALGLAT